MGGKVFTKGSSPLATPRMSEEVYIATRDHMQQRLSCLFRKVATPFEAPGKSDYGDVDLLVAGPYHECWNSAEILANELKALRWTRVHNSLTTSYALAHPSQAAFIQVDIHLCSTETFEWQVFHQSHGDLWNLIGTSIRPKGLTANHDGLHMRIEEIESFDRKRSLVFLTRDPFDVIALLSIDRSVLEGRISSVNDLYCIVSKSRLFDPQNYLKATLKANDKKRLAQREIFRNFVEGWIPARDWTNTQPLLSREQLVDEVLNRFNKKKIYEEKVHLHRKSMAESAVKQQLKIEKQHVSAMNEEYANAWIAWLLRGG